jgi:hypothetical protein
LHPDEIIEAISHLISGPKLTRVHKAVERKREQLKQSTAAGT